MKELVIGGATLNQTPLDWSGNLRNILEAINQARNEGIKILCFPELTITAYGCEDLFLSEWLPTKALSMIPEIAKSCIDITVAIGLPVIYQGKTYNCVGVISNGAVLGFTAKQNLAIDGVHYEFRWFTPWKAHEVVEFSIMDQVVPFGDVIYSVEDIIFGFEICEDAWRENRPGYRLYERKVDLILNPSASHFALQKTLQRQELVLESSRKFECIYLYVNLLGNESGRMIYDGEILIAGNGKLLNKNEHLSFRPYNILKQSVDFEEEKKPASIVTLEALSKEEEFTRATCIGLFDYLRKSRSAGFVLSLSGGADSSTCAVLVSEMVRRGMRELGHKEFLKRIGKSELHEIDGEDDRNCRQIVESILTTVYQGTRNSSASTLSAAKAVADNIGAKFVEWSIDNEVESYTKTAEAAINRKLSWDHDDIALQNIQARTRSPIIWMMANLQNALLLTTSNRSEGDVGYATMDGDTSGSLAPIAAIDKPFIQNWLRWAETNLGYGGLAEVNSLKPTAELRPPDKEQSDENDLMPYNILVEIERSAIRDRQSPVEVYIQLKDKISVGPAVLKKHIRTFFTLWSRNQWKRERIAPSFHLDDFNIDPKTWCRFPIISGGFREELADLDRI